MGGSKNSLACVVVLLAAPLILCHSAAAIAPAAATNLRVNDLVAATPVCDEPTPQFSWQPVHAQRGQWSSAYRVQAALTADFSSLLWDTGRVVSNASHHITYGGAPLQSDSTVFWRVQWWDGDADAAGSSPSPWSAVAHFEVAALTADSSALWSDAQWISAQPLPVPLSAPPRKHAPRRSSSSSSGHTHRHRHRPPRASHQRSGVRDPPADASTAFNVFRSAFTLSADEAAAVVRARLWIAALGVSEVHVNGRRVSADPLGPDWTNTTLRVPYAVHALEASVRAGENVVGVLTGVGWRNTTAFTAPHSTAADALPWQTVRALLRLQFAFANGSTALRVLPSRAADWTCTQGAVLQSSIYDGTWWDARRALALEGWDNSTRPLAGVTWSATAAVPGPRGAMRVQELAVAVSRVLRPLGLGQPTAGAGEWVVDFGQNFAGVLQLSIPASCAAGTVIELRHAEVLTGDGRLDTGNLRDARATDLYTCAGQADVFVPPFTYHGFRFASVANYPEPLSASALVGLVFHSDVPRHSTLRLGASAVGAFGLRADSDEQLAAGDSLLDRVHHNAVWSQRANLMTLITDCPQRDERLGWTGDVSLSAEAFALNFHSAPMLRHVAALTRDEASVSAGDVHCTIPCVRYCGTDNDPSWRSVYPQLVWTLYRYTGDVQVVSEHYTWLQAGLQRELDLITASSPKNIGGSWGDWCPPAPAGECPNSVPSSASITRNLFQLAELAAALHLSADAATYRAAAVSLQHAIHSDFFTNSSSSSSGPGIGLYADGQQSSTMLMLHAAVPAAAAGAGSALEWEQLGHWLNDVSARGGAATSGILGSKATWLTLAREFGRTDALVDLLHRIQYPSFGFMMFNPSEPATTMWELWNAPTGGTSMNSRNHHMYSSVSQALYESLAGLQLLELLCMSTSCPAAPATAFDHVRLSAPATTALTAASVAVASPRGELAFAWQRHGGEQCAATAADHSLLLTLDCGALGGVIETVSFASLGSPIGGCGGGLAVNASCHAPRSREVVAAACVGRARCEVPAESAVFGAPGPDCPTGGAAVLALAASVTCSQAAALTAHVRVPVGASAEVWLPPLTMSAPLQLFESGALLWQDGRPAADADPAISVSYAASGPAEIARHVPAPSAVVATVSSGDFRFELRGDAGVRVCGAAAEGQSLMLACPSPDQTITFVSFASFGDTQAVCGGCAAALQRGVCSAGTSRAVLERACLHQNSCTVQASSAVFGMSCPAAAVNGQSLQLVAEVVCAEI